MLANVTGRMISVPSSTDLTALGCAHMAMRGLGAKTLPPFPPPRRIVAPGAPLLGTTQRFAEAVKRAKAWKK